MQLIGFDYVEKTLRHPVDYDLQIVDVLVTDVQVFLICRIREFRELETDIRLEYVFLDFLQIFGL